MLCKVSLATYGDEFYRQHNFCLLRNLVRSRISYAAANAQIVNNFNQGNAGSQIVMVEIGPYIYWYVVSCSVEVLVARATRPYSKL